MPLKHGRCLKLHPAEPLLAAALGITRNHHVQLKRGLFSVDVGSYIAPHSALDFVGLEFRALLGPLPQKKSVVI